MPERANMRMCGWVVNPVFPPLQAGLSRIRKPHSQNQRDQYPHIYSSKYTLFTRCETAVIISYGIVPAQLATS